MNNQHNPRQPTKHEIQSLIDYIEYQYYMGGNGPSVVVETLPEAISQSYIAVFDNCTITARRPFDDQSSALHGKLMVIIWRSDPKHAEMFLDDGDHFSPIET